MEVNKEEALRSLAIAQRKRAQGQLDAALRFANKSVTLYPTPEGRAMAALIEKDIASGSGGAGASASGGGAGGTPGDQKAGGSVPEGKSARASGVEEHVTSAQHRHKKPETKSDSGASTPPKREYTAKQLEVVTRIKKCREYEYYEILAGEYGWPCRGVAARYTSVLLLS